MILNVVIGGAAAVVAALNWNNPPSQFWVGMNVMLALWCFSDFFKEARRSA
ncbi:MAG: hypothetical protein JWP25_4716 [Bradyrhizobium sp.]|nr:hypothetical protein [Bradyrhizobium sp.]